MGRRSQAQIPAVVLSRQISAIFEAWHPKIKYIWWQLNYGRNKYMRKQSDFIKSTFASFGAWWKGKGTKIPFKFMRWPPNRHILVELLVTFITWRVLFHCTGDFSSVYLLIVWFLSIVPLVLNFHHECSSGCCGEDKIHCNCGQWKFGSRPVSSQSPIISSISVRVELISSNSCMTPKNTTRMFSFQLDRLF